MNGVQAHLHFCWHSHEKNQKSWRSMLFQQQPHLLPRHPAAACLLIISFKGYEPKLELLSYSPWQVSMRKLLQLQLLQPSRNQNIVQKPFFHFKRRNKMQLYRIETCNFDWNTVISEYLLATGTSWDRKAQHQITYMGSNSVQTLGTELSQRCGLSINPLSSKAGSACTLRKQCHLLIEECQLLGRRCYT